MTNSAGGTGPASGRVRVLRTACALVAVLLVSACSGRGGAAPARSSGPPADGPTSPASTAPPASGASEALLLVPAIWRVRDAEGESSETWIRFDSEIDLIRPKGDVDLSWSTQGDSLLARVEGWSMTLGTERPIVPWLTSTTRFVRDGDGWTLTDVRGRRTARLVLDGSPPPSEQALHDVPEVDGSVRERHGESTAGPSVRDLDPEVAVGTWGLPGVATVDASVALTADGTWTARTSCEVLGSSTGGGGAYRLLPSGLLLVTAGAVAGTGCSDPVQPPPADATAILEFSEAGSIAVSGSRMTVYDRGGTRLGTLEKQD